MKNIVVSGDLIRDYSLIKSPRSPSWFLEAVPHTLLRESRGGAWYLGDLVGLACSDLEARIAVPDPGRPGRRAYTIWTRHARVRGDKAEVWRVSEFLGCEPAPEGAAADQGADPGPADLLVLDDLGLDFRARPELWPAGLGDGPPPAAVVLKHSQPVAQGPLWDRLVESFADRLTVVLPASALRVREAKIQDSLSWDLTIEETARELEEGASALDLGRARRVVVQFGAAGAASFSREPGQDRVRFERFLYHPELLEATWNTRHPGRMFGLLSCLAAAVARHAVEPPSYPLFIAMGRGLRAGQAIHELGGGSGSFDPDLAREDIRAIYHPRPAAGRAAPEPAAAFFAGFPHSILADPVMRRQPALQSDLLRDLAGTGPEYLAARGTEVVLRGPGRALAAAPRARYGGYLTADREEIERINAIRALIQSYLQNPADRRPLSIAVFGQPGSGKSFAIKQLATELFPGQKPIEFNLAQWERPAELHAAFHQVRDACLLGQIPLVFWDEFDSGGLRWLKPFLAPMQDAEFQQASRAHHLGRAIFVFAGGTCADFDSFDRSLHPDPAVRDEFRKVKGPDFVSRLRTHLNIKGPNPGERDPDWLIRRAILLRTLLERHWPRLIDPGGNAAVSPSVIRGFLRVERYLHGARSLEMVVSASRPGARFDPAALPGEDILRSHVTPDFIRHVAEGELELPVIEALAEACHAGWYRVREEDGWSFGSPRDDARRLHPMMRPYAELSEEDKEKSRITARLTNAKLLEIGRRIVRFTPDDQKRPPDVTLSEAERDRLMEIEHDIWLRDRLLQGYQYAPVTDESLRLHRDVVPFRDQLPEDRRLDQAIAEAIPATLARRQYKLVEA